MSSDAVLSLRGISKNYHGISAVEKFSLELAKGEFVCLLGPSGCGKTTTLMIVAGFVEPTAGTVVIDGRDVTYLPPYTRNTGMVFQSYALFPHMTVAQNIEFGLQNLGRAKAERVNRVKEMLELVQLSELADRLPRELSGGQQQRVALARALALQPALLLLDEPFSNLDAQLRLRMRDELQRVVRKIEMTTLFVTHDQEEALALSDRVVVMNKGRIEQVGGPEEIYETPATRFVAEFIGWCSMLEGRIDEAGMFVSACGQIRFRPTSTNSRLVVAVLRPEALKLATEHGAGEIYRARVDAISYVGSVSRLKLDIGGNTFLMQSHFPGHRRPREGDCLEVRIDSARVHLLPTVEM